MPSLTDNENDGGDEETEGARAASKDSVGVGPPSAVATKRPRGRPRKRSLPAAGEPSSSPAGGPVSPPSPESPSIPRTAPQASGSPSATDPAGAPALPASLHIKRGPGRPRKHPLPQLVVGEPATGTSPPATGPAISGHAEKGNPAIIVFKRRRGRPRKNTTGLAGFPERGVLPAGPLAPPPPAGASPATLQRTTGGPTHPRRRSGHRRKARIPPFTIAPGGQSPFCPDCGTYIRVFKPKRGRWRRVCPRCHPERMLEKRDPRFSLDKTGIPCKDRGKCRPERCVKALECTEMARKGTIRGSSQGTGG